MGASDKLLIWTMGLTLVYEAVEHPSLIALGMITLKLNVTYIKLFIDLVPSIHNIGKDQIC